MGQPEILSAIADGANFSAERRSYWVEAHVCSPEWARPLRDFQFLQTAKRRTTTRLVFWVSRNGKPSTDMFGLSSCAGEM